MKKLGKKRVIIETSLDGKLQCRTEEIRVVYEHRGAFLINWLGDKKEVVQAGADLFLYQEKVKTIRPVSFQAILAKIAGKKDGER